MCVTDLIKKQFVLWWFYCCCATIQKELKGLRSDDSNSNKGFEENCLERNPIFPAAFKSWDMFLSVSSEGTLTAPCKAGGKCKLPSLSQGEGHRGSQNFRSRCVIIASLSPLCLPGWIRMIDTQDSCLRAEGKQREVENLWGFTDHSPFTFRCCLHPQYVVTPPEKQWCWSLPGLDQLSPVQCFSQLAVQEALLSLPLLAPPLLQWGKVPSPHAVFSRMPQTSYEKTAF